MKDYNKSKFSGEPSLLGKTILWIGPGAIIGTVLGIILLYPNWDSFFMIAFILIGVFVGIVVKLIFGYKNSFPPTLGNIRFEERLKIKKSFNKNWLEEKKQKENSELEKKEL